MSKVTVALIKDGKAINRVADVSDTERAINKARAELRKWAKRNKIAITQCAFKVY
ncbi:MAG: hypothetical protein AB7U82_27940 [Blastocatellales bacterium]